MRRTRSLASSALRPKRALRRAACSLRGAVEAGYIESARVALTAGGGAARFDWVKITSRQ